MGQERSWHEPITFTPADGQGIKYPHEDALVISTVMEGHRVHKTLVDDDSLMNILSAEAMTKIGMDAFRMTIVPTPLIGIEGSAMLMKGAEGLIVTMGTAPCCVTLQQTLWLLIPISHTTPLSGGRCFISLLY
jgi:hypothetical protein